MMPNDLIRSQGRCHVAGRMSTQCHGAVSGDWGLDVVGSLAMCEPSDLYDKDDTIDGGEEVDTWHMLPYHV